MKHNITFVPKAFDNYKDWAVNDKQIFDKINELISNYTTSTTPRLAQRNE